MGISNRSYFAPSFLFAILLMVLSSFILNGVDAAPLRTADVLDMRSLESLHLARDLETRDSLRAADIEVRAAEPNKCVEYINSKGQSVKAC